MTLPDLEPFEENETETDHRKRLEKERKRLELEERIARSKHTRQEKKRGTPSPISREDEKPSF